MSSKVEQAAPSGGDAFVGALNQIADFLAIFVVEESCTVVDLAGVRHTFRPVLAARRVLAATVLVNEILSVPQSEEVAEVVAKARTTMGLAAALQALLTRSVEGSVADKIDELFEVVQPELLDAARASCAGAGIKGLDGKVPTNPLDLFELDQVIEALLPFSARVASKVGQTLRRTTRPRSLPDLSQTIQ